MKEELFHGFLQDAASLIRYIYISFKKYRLLIFVQTDEK